MTSNTTPSAEEVERVADILQQHYDAPYSHHEYAASAAIAAMSSPVDAEVVEVLQVCEVTLRLDRERMEQRDMSVEQNKVAYAHVSTLLARISNERKG